MEKIQKIIIGTNNVGKYKEICALLPEKIKILSPIELKISEPEENGKTFFENSIIKASYFSKKTNLVCLADDSGLEIDLLNGAPGIFSSRWGGKTKDFDIAIKKVFKEMEKINKNWKKYNEARFVCCLTLFWPDGKIYSSKGEIKGRISNIKKGNKGFGYDPIFIPNGYNKTFGEMEPKLKISIDHRFKAFNLLKFFIN